MPTITFEVNLSTPLRDSHAPSSNLRAEGDVFEDTRQAWFPNKILNNHNLKHGNQFTVSGADAVYLKDNYTTGDFALLTIISEALEFSIGGEPI